MDLIRILRQLKFGISVNLSNDRDQRGTREKGDIE